MVYDGQGQSLKLKVEYSSLMKQGSNVISFELTKGGYRVKVNAVDLNTYTTNKDSKYLIKSTLDYENINKISVQGLSANVKSLNITKKIAGGNKTL